MARRGARGSERVVANGMVYKRCTSKNKKKENPVPPVPQAFSLKTLPIRLYTTSCEASTVTFSVSLDVLLRVQYSQCNRRWKHTGRGVGPNPKYAPGLHQHTSRVTRNKLRGLLGVGDMPTAV